MRRHSNVLCWAAYGGVLVASAVVVAVLVCVLPSAQHCGPPPVCAAGAPRPLYRDPIYDGAADPVIVRDAAAGRWLMFYTARRATAPGLRDVEWMHATEIGMAASDDGTHWSYNGTAEFEWSGRPANATFWAPDVQRGPDGRFHMFVTIVPGVFFDWARPRTIVHFTSADLRRWTFAGELALASTRVLDAAVAPLPAGGWGLWYSNEADQKSIHWATSTDLSSWTDQGRIAVDVRRPGEGPFVFRWRGACWLVVDHWNGLGVYRSDDCVDWSATPRDLLAADGGLGAGDHAAVVVRGQRAWIVYAEWSGARTTALQAAELAECHGALHAQRRGPICLRLS